jgi:hypothetical protein
MPVEPFADPTANIVGVIMYRVKLASLGAPRQLQSATDSRIDPDARSLPGQPQHSAGFSFDPQHMMMNMMMSQWMHQMQHPSSSPAPSPVSPSIAPLPPLSSLVSPPAFNFNMVLSPPSQTPSSSSHKRQRDEDDVPDSPSKLAKSHDGEDKAKK